MKWLILAGRLRPSGSRLQLNAAVKRRKRKNRSLSEGAAGKSRWYRWALGILILLGAGGGVWWFLTHSPYFSLHQILVSNNHSYSPEEVLALAAIPAGVNLFVFQPEVCRQRVLEETNIRDAAVERIFPDTIRLKVFEREARARVKFGRYYTIDDWGVVLRGCKESDGGDLPVVTGLKIKNDHLYPPPDAEKCLALLRGMEREGISGRLKINEINLSDSDLFVIHAFPDLEVRLAPSDMDAQLKRWEKLLPYLADNPDRVQSVDLRYAQVPVSYAD